MEGGASIMNVVCPPFLITDPNAWAKHLHGLLGNGGHDG